ncbi:G-type lectin S-receptor-like serine/threonine-protein kinase [Thalictrum thalictroides]|uniref:G-type lectin S-receptor-like serine/threonine-protein kinase n=1 Tax=Thalictrum thalictroides TaxID=46969 RepID=A0A7J6WST1_THATH|nr:G-type lectin S-receptor-like serine/threonine-protein kinase [Thalictrum thalictroides]
MYKRGQFLELVDPRLEDEVNNEQVEMLVKLALCCLHQDPRLRPSMTNVVRIIEGKMAVGKPQVNSLKFLNFYGYRSIEDNTIETTTARTTTTTPDRKPILSYISSEQVSGPR